MVELSESELEQIIEKTRQEISTSRVFTKKQKALLLIYLGLAIVSVIPTVEYGAGFTQHLTLAIAPGLKNDSGALEGIRLPFALISGLVNGIINTRSFYFAMAAIATEISKIYYTEENIDLLKAWGVFASKLAFIGTAAIPNWQIVKGGAKEADVHWPPFITESIQSAVCFGAAGIVFRGIEGVWANFSYSRYARVIPSLRKKQDEAAAIRLQLLQILKPHLSHDDLIQLSQGYRYKGPSFLTNFLTKTLLFIAPALFYSYAAYYWSTDEAEVDFLDIEHNTAFWRSALRHVSDITATLGRGMILGNVASLIAENLLNSRAYDRLTGQYLHISLSDIVSNFLVTFITVFSLTGAMGLVYEYLFNESVLLHSLLLSIGISLWGAGAINFGDVKTVYDGSQNVKTLMLGDVAKLPPIEDEQVAADVVKMTPAQILQEKDSILAGRVGHFRSTPLTVLNADEGTRLLPNGSATEPNRSHSINLV